ALHHQPKDSKDSTTPQLRGHGSFLGGIDTSIHIAQDGTIRTARTQKVSDGPDDQSVAFTLKSIIVGIDAEGTETTAPVVEASTAPAKPAPKSKPRMPRGARIALDALNLAIDEMGETVTSNHIPRAVKITTVDRWRTYAIKKGISDSNKPDSTGKAFK